MNLGEQIAADAWTAFDRWCDEHDPEGEMSVLEQVEAYGKWCDANPPVTKG